MCGERRTARKYTRARMAEQGDTGAAQGTGPDELAQGSASERERARESRKTEPGFATESEREAQGAKAERAREPATQTVSGTVVRERGSEERGEERARDSVAPPRVRLHAREVRRDDEREYAPRGPTAWSRLPDAEELGLAAREAGRVAGRVASRVGGSVREGAGVVARGVGAGFARASGALDVPESASMEGLVGATDLPELGDGDALYDLGRRLDREADLFRGVALRAIARAQWADRIALGVALLCATGGAALAVVCGLGALFGSASAGARALLAFSSMGVLLLGALAVFLATLSTRNAQRTLAREALARADLAELRLSRVAALLALRVEDTVRFREALSRLERDASAPSR